MLDPRPLTALALALALSACGGDSAPATTDSADAAADASADTALPAGEPALACPAPGPLPFAVAATAFDTEAASTLLAEQPRIKDTSADYLGNPGGPGTLTTHVAGEALLDGTAIPLVGRIARSPVDLGLGGDPVVGEWVSAWRPLTDGTFRVIDRARTDDDGRYAFALTGDDRFAAGSHAAYAVLEGVGACVEHGVYLWPAHTPVVVTDIDGTLTTSDTEFATQLGDGAYVPAQYPGADALLRAWAAKGYGVVYMTARPHAFRAETRAWLANGGYPPGPILTANVLVLDEAARIYKRDWLALIQDDLGWDIVAAYGNAQSDIDAYADAALPKDITFIIGPGAGDDGTTPIAGDDYTAHTEAYVGAVPDADARP